MSNEDPFGDAWAHLRRATTARIALGRTGDSLPTQRVLEFALAHARARDAVHASLNIERLIMELGDPSPIVVKSQAENRAQYLQRPDFGRRLAPDSRARLHPGPYDAALVLADGLSAQALQTQGAALAKLIAASPAWRFAPPVIAQQGRVALGDEITEALGTLLVVVLIGERPGLSASDSLGAYITYAPRAGVSKDSNRNCISNIRPDGLSLEDAAKRILAMIGLAQKLKCTGTLLKEDDALALDGGSA
ncbi:ethanolamine ammonia-lyase subunit EutC [Methyloferula stellata]|uniref:ethanolamine ammonia-lyase subunit EutC n=1 Tax=Methyloferula stellata TaxID=876270 RepID=UPI00037DF1A3|nr:ethanolamine ammonia-lyase subunit EutC [Methyloferula stellata]